MVIGITGGFCTGKTEVVRHFKALGAKVIDLDKLAHSALTPGTRIFKKVVNDFGRDILKYNRIDRALFAAKVFGNKDRLKRLNSIIHPVVIEQMIGLIKKWQKGSKAIVVEVPLLFEVGLRKYFDYVIVVKASKKNQIIRAKRKAGFGKSETLKRINSQWPLKRKMAKADFVIDGNMSIKEVKKQAEKIWNSLVAR